MKHAEPSQADTHANAYQAATTGAGLRDESSHARLWLSGQDRIAFLQRLTTNDVRLSAGQGTVTILTSPTARIVAVLTLLAYDDGLLILAGPGEGPKLFTTLRSQIFFADQVAVEGRGSTFTQFGLYGPRAAAVLAAAGAPGADRLAPFAWRQVALAGVRVIIQPNEGLRWPGFTLLAPAADGALIQAALLTAGAQPLPEAAFEVLRVEAGVPAPGHELTDQVNPLEAGLRRFCDDHKGCYTGQEIIARQITYDKVTSQLVGLLPQRPVTPGAAITMEGRRIGFVSSAVHSLGLDRPIALAFLRRPHHQAGTQVTVDLGIDPVQAEVALLPFTGR